MFRPRCCRIYRISLIPASKRQLVFIPYQIRWISISGRNIESNDQTPNNDAQSAVPWPLLCDYAYKSNLLKLKSTEIRDWLKLYDHRIETDSIQIRDVNSYGQKYIT